MSEVLKTYEEELEIKEGFKKTKIGWIPKDWEVDILGNHLKINSGNSPSKFILLKEGDFPYLKVEDLNNCYKYQSESRFYINQNDNLIESDSVIFPKRGAAILNNKIRKTVVPCQMDSNMMAVKSTSDILSNEYLYYFILSEKLLRIADTSTIPQINNKHILPYKIALPPLSEQQKIASILSDWDVAIKKTSDLIDKLKKRKKGLMQQLLTGKTRLSGFSDEWKEYNYNELLREVKRPVNWGDNELYRLISVRRRSVGLFHRESLLGKEIKTKNLRTAKTGDFLISKMQIVHGASGLVTEEYDDMKISGSYISLRAKKEKELNMEFFNYLSKQPYFYYQTYISSYGVHIEKMTFNFKSFLKLKTEIPSLDEQNGIIVILDAADQEIKEQQNYLEHLQTQKKGLMQQLLTGKIRVK